MVYHQYTFLQAGMTMTNVMIDDGVMFFADLCFSYCGFGLSSAICFEVLMYLVDVILDGVSGLFLRFVVTRM